MAYTLASAIEELKGAWGLHRDSPCDFPAENFERAVGLSNISKTYVLPGGETEDDIQRAITQESGTRLVLRYFVGTAATVEPLSGTSIRQRQIRIEKQIAKLEKEAEAIRNNPEYSADDAEETVGKLGYLYNAQDQMEVLGKLFGVNPKLTVDDLREAFLESDKKVNSLVQNYYTDLCTLNPELAQLKPETPRQQYDIVLGAVSRFNVPDIKHFSIDGVTYSDAQQDPRWLKKQQEIEGRTKRHMGWVPAHSTLDNVLRQLDRKEQKEAGISR